MNLITYVNNNGLGAIFNPSSALLIEKNFVGFCYGL